MDDNTKSSNGHILLVEDDEFLRDLILHKCEEGGFEVAIARDGEEALKVAKNRVPDLILLDLILPGMSGFELVGKLRQDEATAKVPFLVLSNSAEVQNKEESERLGAEGYFVKAQTTPSDIVKKITEWFAQRPQT
jgi:two-component system alkaline phosphatase synthesis response regulator PhoP